MSLSHSPQIVTNGLLAYFDSANKRSFNPTENLLTYTNSIGISGQKYANGAAVITTLNAATAPDGTLTATKIDNNGNSTANYVFSQIDAALSTSTVYTYSIFVKPVSSNLTYVTLDENDFGGKRYQMYFNIGNETVTTQTIGTQSDGSILSSGVVKYPNNWYRIYITFKTGSTTVSNLVDMISRYSTSNVGYNYFWGRQLETGAYMTDYSPVLTTTKLSRPTTFTDLKSNKVLTLSNSPKYSSSNNGYIDFYSDGSNNSTGQYATISSVAGWQSLSTFIYIKDVGTAWKYLFDGRDDGQQGWFAGAGGVTGIGGYWTGMYINGISTALNWDLIPKNQWIHLYIEGNTARTTTLNLFSRISNNEYNSGYLANLSLYNKKLSLAEILQNYSALKGRYSL
jgi:hypothetical protein